MADEQEQNETVEETTAAPEAAEETPAAVAEEAPAAQDAPAADAAPAIDAGPPASPKERRQQARAKRAARNGDAKPRTPAERQAERAAARAAKATRRRAARAKLRAKASEARAASPAQATPPHEHGPGRQKVRQGIVVSDKADKTITVRTDVARRHRRYEKIVRSSNTLHAHDERNDAHVGDTVVVRESRPLSRLKRWRLVEVVERAK
jgi:small subunit ribosomal protein S17